MVVLLRAVALATLLNVAAAVPSSIQLPGAALLVARRAEGHGNSKISDAKQAKLEARTAEEEALFAEEEFKQASEAEALAMASVETAAAAADFAETAAARREENQEVKREANMEAKAREQAKALEDAERDRKVALREAKEWEVKAEAARVARAAAEAKAAEDRRAHAKGLVLAGPILSQADALLNGSKPNRTGAAALFAKARARAKSPAEAEVYQAAQLDLKLAETHGRKVLWYHFQIPKAAGMEASLIAMRLLCEVQPQVAATLWSKAVDWKHNKARCAMECPSKRLVDTQYSCAAEGRKEQQPWENALYRVNTLLLNHKTVDQAVVFTVLREPLSRVVAHWLHCENELLKLGKVSHGTAMCSHGAKAPPAGTRLMSNESFSWFLQQHADGPSAEQEGWDNGFRTANLQVGMIASVPKGRAVTAKDLKKAKRILSADKGPLKWVVGTTDTMYEFYLELAARAGRPVSDTDTDVKPEP